MPSDGESLAASAPLATSAAPGCGVSPVRLARLLPRSPTGSGMPLARGALGAGGLLRGGRLGGGLADAGSEEELVLDVGEALGRVVSAIAALRPRATRRSAAAAARDDSAAASEETSESHRDGSGLPERRLVANAASSESGPSSILFMSGVTRRGAAGYSNMSSERYSSEHDSSEH